jgi:hypothetical protein
MQGLGHGQGVQILADVGQHHIPPGAVLPGGAALVPLGVPVVLAKTNGDG